MATEALAKACVSPTFLDARIGACPTNRPVSTETASPNRNSADVEAGVDAKRMRLRGDEQSRGPGCNDDSPAAPPSTASTSVSVQKLPREARPSGAERQSDRDLFLSRSRSDGEEARHVDAGEDEREDGQRQEQSEGGAELAADARVALAARYER